MFKMITVGYKNSRIVANGDANALYNSMYYQECRIWFGIENYSPRFTYSKFFKNCYKIVIHDDNFVLYTETVHRLPLDFQMVVNFKRKDSEKLKMLYSKQ